MGREAEQERGDDTGPKGRAVIGRGAAEPLAANPPFDAPAVRPSSALTADAADGQAFLEWNPGLEDDLAGYRVYRRAPEGSRFEWVTAKPIEGTTFTDTGLTNGMAYRYRVTSVLPDGKESEPSNEIAVEPRAPALPLRHFLFLAQPCRAGAGRPLAKLRRRCRVRWPAPGGGDLRVAMGPGPNPARAPAVHGRLVPLGQCLPAVLDALGNFGHGV